MSSSTCAAIYMCCSTCAAICAVAHARRHVLVLLGYAGDVVVVGPEEGSEGEVVDVDPHLSSPNTNTNTSHLLFNTMQNT
jgi:hypothetical protein